MATAYCLPKSHVEKFRAALDSGRLDTAAIADMDSLSRRKTLAEYVGKEHAEEVNALFEKKLLQVNYIQGLKEWAEVVGQKKPEIRDDIIAKIQRMETVLTPENETAFLADLAKQKLGFGVTASEAERLFNASNRVEQLRKMMVDAGWKAGTDVTKAYGHAVLDFKDLFNSMKPNGRTWGQRLLEVLNVNRALQTTLDLSAVFNQGWGMLSRKQGWEGFGNMFKYLASEKNYRDLQAYIVSHPNYEIARKSGLALTDLSDRLSLREEEIQSSLVEKAFQYLKDASGGVVPNIIRGSNRAYTGYLNYVRFNTFNELIEHAKRMGEDIQPGSKDARDIAKSINDFTGRGNLGFDDQLGHWGPIANLVLYAPRKISATMNMFNPVRYLYPRISKTARMASARQLLGSVAATTAVLTLAQSMGATVDLNPTSSSFLSAKYGDHSIDLTGGNAVYLRFLARLYFNSLTTASGKEIEFDDGSGFSPISRGSLTMGFFRNKLAPTASFVTDAMFGKDSIGRPFDLTQEARDRLVPISMGSILDYFHSDPEEATKVIFPLLAVFGSNLSSPLPPESKFGTTVWGEPAWRQDSAGLPAPAKRNVIDKEAFRLGISLNVPPNRISGVKLTDEQYKEYIVMSGQLVKQRLEPMISNPGWGQLADGLKAKTIKGVILKVRTMVQNAIQGKSVNSDNDLVKKSNEEKAKQFR